MASKGRMVGGVYHAWLTPDALLQDIRKFEVRDEDLWVITYPKAGTTWTQEIVSVLLNDCDTELADLKPIDERYTFIDFTGPVSSPVERLNKQPSPRLIKTHIQPHQMPEQLELKKPKIIYVGRNPKDNAVSLYHFHRAINELKAYANWGEFLDSFVAGHGHGGSWFDINLYWWSRRHDENVLFLKYEDLKKDLPSGIVEIATFLGCTIPDGGLEKIVNHCSFDSMKKNPKTNYEDKEFINKEISKFMRKGTVGDWKNYFTVAQNEIFDRLYEEKLKGSGLVFDFEL